MSKGIVGSGSQHVLRRALYYSVIFAVAFCLFWVQSVDKGYNSEFLNHIALARNVVAPAPFGFAIPHPGFHWLVLGLAWLTRLSHPVVGVCVAAGSVLAIAILNNHSLAKAVRGRCTERQVLWFGAGLLLVSAIYCPPINDYFYLGQGCPNVWGVPTLVVVKPFALGSLLLLVALGEASSARAQRRIGLGLAACLLLSVVMKPSFIIAFLPVAGVYALLKHQPSRAAMSTLVVLAFVPSVLLLGYQFYTHFYASKDPIIFTWFGVWKLYTKHLLPSILLGVAFPLALTVCRWRALRQNHYLALSWAYWAVGFVQFAFVAETKAFSHGNFSWGYNIGLWFLFIFCTAELLSWLNESRDVRGRSKLGLALVSSLWALHLLSGVVYLGWQLSGHNYY